MNIGGIMTGKTHKSARPGYYACGKKKPVEIGGTPELLARKREVTGSEAGRDISDCTHIKETTR
jgi:hypothetical protein